MDTAHVINLTRRPERWAAFRKRLPGDWPLPPIERFEAIDGKEVAPPAWWRSTSGAWGCRCSHVAVLERAMQMGAEVSWIFEDDAVFCRHFAERFRAFLAIVPSDWDMIYLGGELLHRRKHRPQVVRDGVLRPFNVNRQHAYAVRAKAFEALHVHLHDFANWHRKGNTDHHVGTLHESRRLNVYCPAEFLVGQAAGRSDIDRKTHAERFL